MMATQLINAYWNQAQKANEVFQMLNGKQRKLALIDECRDEEGTDTVKLTGKKERSGRHPHD